MLFITSKSTPRKIGTAVEFTPFSVSFYELSITKRTFTMTNAFVSFCHIFGMLATGYTAFLDRHADLFKIELLGV